MRRLALLLALLLICAGCASVRPAAMNVEPAPLVQAAAPCEPVLVRVVDGDTWDVAVGGLVVRLRLARVDTPERGEVNFREAADFTRAWLTAGPQVSYQYEGMDRWNRPLVAVTREGDAAELSAALLVAGLAKVYTREKGK